MKYKYVFIVFLIVFMSMFIFKDTFSQIYTYNVCKDNCDYKDINVIGKSIFADANGNFTRIWQDNIILAYVPNLGASRTEYDP